jgi:hypothetical protein
MNPVGDTFTVGIVLLLLIGAVAFYLYTRIGQVEKRINLLENILLDLKVATENAFMGFPSPASGGGGSGSMHEQNKPMTAEEEEELLSEYVPKLPIASSRTEAAEEEEENDETRMYEAALESALESAAAEEGGADAVASDADKSVEVSSSAAPAAPKSEVHVNKLETAYTEMNVKELRSIAQARGITSVGKLSRKELIDALQKRDSGVVDGIEASPAGVAFESSLIGDAMAVDA